MVACVRDTFATVSCKLKQKRRKILPKMLITMAHFCYLGTTIATATTYLLYGRLVGLASGLGSVPILVPSNQWGLQEAGSSSRICAKEEYGQISTNDKKLPAMNYANLQICFNVMYPNLSSTCNFGFGVIPCESSSFKCKVTKIFSWNCSTLN